MAITIDHSDKLVANRHWHRNRFLGPCVPVVNVNVRPADRGFQDTNKHVIAADFRDRNFFEPQSRLGLGLHDGLHHLLHDKKLGESGMQESRKVRE